MWPIFQILGTSGSWACLPNGKAWLTLRDAGLLWLGHVFPYSPQSSPLPVAPYQLPSLVHVICLAPGHSSISKLWSSGEEAFEWKVLSGDHVRQEHCSHFTDEETKV